MTRREAFHAIMNHKEPDRVLLDLGGCPLSGMSPEAEVLLFDHMGYTGNRDENLEKLLVYLDIDTRGVGDILVSTKSQARRISDIEAIDDWGIRRRYTGQYWDIIDSPLRNATADDLDNYPWPDPDAFDENVLAQYEARAKFIHEETDYVVCASHPVLGVFELGCWMCGFDEFLVRIALDEEFTEKFCTIVLNYQKKAIEQYYPRLSRYIDYTSSGDDFATQQSTFISPAMFEEYVAPYFSERIRYTKQFTDAKYLHHSCGNVARLIPQLVECGVEILNPIQPTGDEMAPQNLKTKYGASVVFHGGLDTQEVLPGGTRETVEKAVHELLSVMQPGGGYIFAAAHNLQGDVPPENIIAMFQAARRFGR